MEPERYPELETDVSSVLEAVRGRTPVQPCGIIFHISRCGSTLVSNGIKAITSAVVASEAQPVSALLDPNYDVSVATKAPLKRQRELLLRSLFTVISTYQTGSAQELVLKLSSLNTICISEVRALFPAVPIVLVVRDPVEVVVSNLQGGGGWLSHRKQQSLAEALGMPHSTAAYMDDVEYAAFVVGMMLRRALENVDGIHVLDYEDIDGRSIRRVASLFGLTHSPEEQTLVEVLSSYSKDATRTQRGVNDTATKQAVATADVRRHVERHAEQYYRALRAPRNSTAHTMAC